MRKHHHNINLLKIYLYFRSALSLLLCVMFLSPTATEIVGTVYPKLYMWTSLVYASLCITTAIFYPADKLLHSFNRLVGSLIIDILAVLTLLHASGGIDSGLGYLILVYVAISAIFVRGQLAIAFAAMTSLMVMAESIYLAQTTGASNKFLFSAGSLGILIFITAYAFQFFSERLRQSNLETQAQAAYAEHLQRLAQLIVRRMRTGIIVLDHQHRIELVNDSALQLLDLPQNLNYHHQSIDEICPLKPLILKWEADRSIATVVEEINPGTHLRVGFAQLEIGESERTVAYLEDHRVMTQQAQQLKLAALGRLTASIAHEVRNPLGAISHAAQLLAESPTIAPADLRLTEIIEQHSARVNGIIESTLAISRRQEPQPEPLNLQAWTPKFLNQYTTGHQASIEYKHYGQGHLIKADPTQLSQILTNLLDNALRYSEKATGKRTAVLNVKQSENDDTAYIEVIDFGEGIPEEKLPNIYDPFFTTDEKGSGLGLYICKELCEINQASLHYTHAQDGSSCFRIDFSHHQRMF